MSDGPKKVTRSRIYAASTLLALVISVPMIVVVLSTHYVFKTNVMITGIAGIVTLFIAMGFAYKLSKRLAARVQDSDGTDIKKT